MIDSQEKGLGPSYDGSVVVDIGGDTGTLVIYTPEAMVGREIEITAGGEHRSRCHSAVRERRLQHRSLYAAVFPALVAGHYTLPSGQGVAVSGGQVTEVRL